MFNFGVVTDTSEDNRTAQVSLLKSSVCVECRHKCSAEKGRITVSNPKNFQISKGTYIRLDKAPAVKYLSALAGLLIPVLLCFSGLYFSPAIFQHFKIECTDFCRFSISFLLLLMGETGLLLFTKSNFSVFKMQIVQII